MEISPNAIYEDYLNDRIDKASLVKQLISIIENHDDNIVRKNSIIVLGKLKLVDENLFDLFEIIFIKT